MKKKYYHATAYENLGSIIEKGLLKSPFDGIVYLCDTDEDAMKFLLVRGITDIIVIEVEINEEDVTEQFDHNIAFFKCKAYGYASDIPFEELGNIVRWKYESRKENR